MTLTSAYTRDREACGTGSFEEGGKTLESEGQGYSSILERPLCLTICGAVAWLCVLRDGVCQDALGGLDVWLYARRSGLRV